MQAFGISFLDAYRPVGWRCRPCHLAHTALHRPQSKALGSGKMLPLAPSITLLFLACLGMLLGGPSVCRAADLIAIGASEYDEPGASGAGWLWRDASTLVLSGYDGPTIYAEGDLTLVLEGQNTATVVAGAYQGYACGVDCWGDLAVCGGGSLVARGQQAGIHVDGAMRVQGCTIDARATGEGMAGSLVSGVWAGSLAVTDGAKLTAASAADVGGGSFGVRCDGASGGLTVVASTVDAAGVTGGIVVAGDIALDGVAVTLPSGGAVGTVTVAGSSGASGVFDAAGVLAPHAVVAPTGSGGGEDGSGGTGSGTGGATKPGAPGGGATGPGTSENPGGSNSSGGNAGGSSAGGGAFDGASGPGASGPDADKPALKPAASPAGDASAAKASASQASQTGARRTSKDGLPALGELPVHIILLALISAAFFCVSFGGSKE